MPGCTVPYTVLLGTGAGSMAVGTPSMPHSSSSQQSRWMSNSMVRLALAKSVTWRPVSFQISQLSTVPNSTSPRSARRRTPGTLSSIQRILLPEK